MTFANKLRFLQELSINQRTKFCSKIMHAGSRRYVAIVSCHGEPMDFEMPRFRQQNWHLQCHCHVPLNHQFITKTTTSLSIHYSSLFTIVVITHHSSTPGRHLSLHLPAMALTKTSSFKNGETNTTCTRL